MSVPGWVQQISNAGQDFQGVLSFGGWMLWAAQSIVGRVRQQWIFRDKATLANERDLALKRAALDQQEAVLCRREADLANHRASVAEETVEALHAAINNLRDALTQELESLRKDVQTLQHKTTLQTSYIRTLIQFIGPNEPRVPEIPLELRDDVRREEM